jgi:hypothetical protein
MNAIMHRIADALALRRQRRWLKRSRHCTGLSPTEAGAPQGAPLVVRQLQPAAIPLAGWLAKPQTST